MASRRTYPIPNKNLSGGDYIRNKRAKQLFSGTSNLAKTIEQQNGNFPLLTPLGKLKPYQGTFGLSGRSDTSTSPSDKTYCLNTSHSYCDLLSITRGKYLLTPPNVSDQAIIKIQDVNDPTKLYNGIYYVYIYSNTTTALYYMNPAYPSTPATYTANQIEYNVLGNANERIIVDPSFILHYQSQSCILRPRLSPNIEINNDYDAKYSFNRTINLDLFTGFQYPIKFSLDYDIGDCIDTSNDLQSKYAFPSFPFSITAPVITGVLPHYLVGTLLTLSSTGSWDGNPAPTFSYQWQKNGVSIPGAIFTTYTIAALDAGQSITCDVTGTNPSGSDVATSNALTPTSLVVNTAIPVISGPPGSPPYYVGYVLTSTIGFWTGSPYPTFVYQWLKNGAAYSPAETNFTYTIAVGDASQLITFQVTGTNVNGSTIATSASVTPILDPPVNSVAPAITGIASVGSTLTTSNGTWGGTPTPTFTYQWKKNGTAIPTETNTTYIIVAGDVSQLIKCDVTGTNASGSSTAPSNSVTPV